MFNNFSLKKKKSREVVYGHPSIKRMLYHVSIITRAQNTPDMPNVLMSK